jgi:hypothetical protein
MSEWFGQHRQDWIREMLYVYGFINREHLVRKFHISVPQASLDLTRYRKTHPEVGYDVSKKCYVTERRR